MLELRDSAPDTDPTINPSSSAARSPALAQWYLIHCKPREDERALENLERQGYECFWPTRNVERRREGFKHIVREALFPRYLFIRLNCVNDNWHSIRSTRGVHQIVRFDAYPVPVRDAIIENIRARAAGALAHEPYLKPGERVRITEGAFSQFEAIFVANDGDERVVLLLNLLQSQQQLTFPARQVRKIG